VTPEQWAEVRRLFETLCDLPREEAQRRLVEADAPEAVRRQVAELLTFDDSSELDRLARGVSHLSQGMADEDLRGERLGAWRLLSPLGEGGMGEVYLAERADGRYEARVAIKFLALSGRRARQLFERERTILARLQHPAIAHLIDAGEHPRLGAWLAMAYVDGESLGELAIAGSLAMEQALSCMVEAARAVAFAHRNLVLHRDLKPEHLMRDRDGQLKVLDFGVATLLQDAAGQAEQTGRASFTPRYAAPEQILGQATTTRTDIYALGLVLHELLCGGSGAFGEEPERLTERKLAGRRERIGHVAGLGRRQWRDLDAVIARCLAVSPEHRYSSAD
jgi:serine/threonine-protein kinase